MNALHAIAEEHLTAANESERGTSSTLLVNDGPLRQAVIALTAGATLPEHNSPPAASIQVLIGSIRVDSASGSVEYRAGDLGALTHERHSVTALADSCFLLTTVTSVDLSTWEESQE